MSKKEDNSTKRSTKTRKPTSSKRVKSKVARKAPTKRSDTNKSTALSYSRKFVIASVVGVLVVGGISMYIGSTDPGVIDVNTIIAERAAREQAKGNTTASAKIKAVTAQKPDKAKLPNGGLIGRGDKETEQQVLEKKKKAAEAKAVVATSTASSSPTLKEATSTDNVTETVASTTDNTKSTVEATTTTPSSQE